MTVIVDSSNSTRWWRGERWTRSGFVQLGIGEFGQGRTARLVLQPFRDGNVYIRVRSTGLAIGAFRIRIAAGISPPADLAARPARLPSP